MPLVLPGGESALNDPGSRFDRHHHVRPYAALVVHGSCEEAGDRGRYRAQAGDVLIHSAFDGHRDEIGARGAVFINFALDEPLPGWFGRIRDLDAIVRAYGRDSAEAAALLAEQFHPLDVSPGDWPDLLARELAGDTRISLMHWAERHHLHPASLSRGFRQAFGVSAKRYRLERIASRAARRIRRGSEPLSAVAASCGFADQAHMTRAIAALFGQTPRSLRRPG